MSTAFLPCGASDFAFAVDSDQTFENGAQEMILNANVTGSPGREVSKSRSASRVKSNSRSRSSSRSRSGSRSRSVSRTRGASSSRVKSGSRSRSSSRARSGARSRSRSRGASTTRSHSRSRSQSRSRSGSRSRSASRSRSQARGTKSQAPAARQTVLFPSHAVGNPSMTLDFYLSMAVRITSFVARAVNRPGKMDTRPMAEALPDEYRQFIIQSLKDVNPLEITKTKKIFRTSVQFIMPALQFLKPALTFQSFSKSTVKVLDDAIELILIARMRLRRMETPIAATVLCLDLLKDFGAKLTHLAVIQQQEHQQKEQQERKK